MNKNNNLLKGAFIALICIFAVYVFFFPPKRIGGNASLKVKDSIETSIDTALVCMDFNTYKPSTLSIGLVNEMVSIYRGRQLKSIQESTSDPVLNDAYSIWFDLDSIKKFIYHIEKGVKKNGVSGSKLGLRLYYAAYPDKSKWGTTGYEDLAGFSRDDVTKEYGAKHTLVMIPTIQNKDSIAMDFNPFEKDTYNEGLKNPKRRMMSDNPAQGANSILIPDITNRRTVMALTTTRTADAASKTMAKNHGVLCPPGGLIGLGF